MMLDLKARIADILWQHRILDPRAAAGELAAIIDEEIEARVQDRVAELRDQIEGR
jgi:hypothetical protein